MAKNRKDQHDEHTDSEDGDHRAAETQESQEDHNDYTKPSIAKLDSDGSNTMHENHDQAPDHEVSPGQEPNASANKMQARIAL